MDHMKFVGHMIACEYSRFSDEEQGETAVIAG